MLHLMQCFECDWFGRTDEPNGECPGCKRTMTLEHTEEDEHTDDVCDHCGEDHPSLFCPYVHPENVYDAGCY